MDRWIKIVLVILMLPSTVSSGLFDILDEEYIDDINDLPFSEGTPVISWVDCPCNIDYRWGKAWIDITGFEDMVKINGSFYVADNPVNHVIVKYGYEKLRGTTVKWEPTLRTYQSGDNVIAELTLKRRWSEMFCGESSCYPVYFSASMTISDSEQAPLIYQPAHNGSVYITEYDNQLEPKIVITVIEPNASKIVVKYNESFVTHFNKVYHVERTPTGIYFANSTDLDSWIVEGSGIARFGNSVIINTNLSTFDYSELDITVSDIFNSVRIDRSELNITRLTYEPEKVVYNPLLFGFIGVLCTLFGASLLLIGRIQL